MPLNRQYFLNYKSKHYIFLSIIIFFFHFSVKSQIKSTIKFQSANPFAMSDVINNLDKLDPQEVFGELTIPSDSINNKSKYPLIIAVAGSLGWRKHHYDYLEMYQKNGFATFELNSFKSRKITSTVGSQIEITTAAMILDAYKAFDKLKTHPNININKVSITGWSLGGAVALFSGWNPMRNAITNNLKFASHLAIYPPCFFDPEDIDFTDRPIHILIGELDNWTPAEPHVKTSLKK
jgi:Dienelactone hydrolase and related enzymes